MTFDFSRPHKMIDGLPVALSQVEIDEFSAAKDTAAPRLAILAQIRAIEARATPRRVREAITSDDGKIWLAALDDEIAKLRSKL
jgi:hypothetical protein